MRRFNTIRDQLPKDGTSVLVQFAQLGKEDVGNGLTINVVEARPVRRFARPKRLNDRLASTLKDRLADHL